ncbi:MAG: LamG-like jellyroll fold domain-containing protein [Planctomycetota bacterium]
MRTGRRPLSFLALTVVVGLVAAPAAQARVFLWETFDTDTTSTADTQATYPNLTFTGGGTIVADGGLLKMSGTFTQQNALSPSGYPGDLVIQAQVGTDPGGGATNQGLRIDGNRLVFHPGYTPIPGALRVEGPGGFGNQDMGFVPAGGGVLHDWQASLDAATGNVQIQVTDGLDPSHVYTASFTSTGYTPGASAVGLTRSTTAGNYVTSYDDLIVRTPGGNERWVEAVVASGPLHWYTLDETTGTVAYDSGSSPLNGTYQNGAALGQGSAGIVGDGVTFDGVDDQIALGGGTLSGAWTAEFILKKLGIEQAGSLMRQYPYALRLDQWNNTGQVGYTHFGVRDYLFSPAASAPLDEFIHLTYVGDPASGLSAYVNGELAGTNPAYIPLPLGTIGAGDAAHALIDEVVIYDRALSQGEILDHMATIPEPATLALLGAGLLAVLRRRRSR